MLTFTTELSAILPYQVTYNLSIKLSDILFFDIETTGFSPDISNIYLIGCCYFENNNWTLVQWFANDYTSELDIIHCFLELLSQHHVLIHYNGDTFDIPFIQKKMLYHKISFPFDTIISIDLYKYIKPWKTLLKLPDLKQKTLENYLHIERKDRLNGKQLITLYVNYIKSILMKKNDSCDNLDMILLHNSDDVSNLIRLTQLLSYHDMIKKTHPINNIRLENNHLHFNFTLETPLQNKLIFNDHYVSLTIHNTLGSINIALYKGELKYFYQNYKDYYYLPLEDSAIHKSVAQFVNKNHKVKAKASTCYTRKNSVFIPCYSMNNLPQFKNSYKDKLIFLEANCNFCSDTNVLSEYLNGLLKYILTQKPNKDYYSKT